MDLQLESLPSLFIFQLLCVHAYVCPCVHMWVVVYVCVHVGLCNRVSTHMSGVHVCVSACAFACVYLSTQTSSWTKITGHQQ
jgi:hypothetical protein